MQSILLNPLLKSAPFIFSLLGLAAAAFFYHKNNWRWLRVVTAALVLLQLAWVAFLTWGQYYVWSRNPVSKAFINSPLPKEAPAQFFRLLGGLAGSHLGYFIYYAWGRFWFRPVVVIISATVIYFLLALINRRRAEIGRFDLLVSFICALAAGWPVNLLFLLGAVFVFYGYYLKEQPAKFRPGFALLLLALFLLIFGPKIIFALKLNSLAI